MLGVGIDSANGMVVGGIEEVGTLDGTGFGMRLIGM